MTREAALKSLFDSSGFGLEIGASYNPLLPKKHGYRVETLDHANQADLIAKYKAMNENTDSIEPVDYVSDGRPMVDVIGTTSKYDYIVASHVIEHSTNLVGFLNDCEALLKPQGVLVLAVPDRRFCFDFFRPLSSLGQIIEASRSQPTRHAISTLIDYYSLYCTRGGEIAWQRPQLGKLVLKNTPASALTMAESDLRDDKYVDAHEWTFTPSSFRYNMKCLADLGFTKLVESHFALTNGFEFYVVLQQNGRGCQPSYAELLNATMLELREVPVDDNPEESKYAQSIGSYVPVTGLTTEITHRRRRTRGPDSKSIVAIIPLYNGLKYIDETLLSIVNQTRPPDEVVVVDDGSTDMGPARVQEFSARHPETPIRLVKKANGGQSSARNLGVANSTSELIAFCDQDDLWYPSHLEELAKPFESGAHRDLGWSYSDLDRVDDGGGMVIRNFLAWVGADHPKTSLPRCMSRDMFVLPSASLIARSAFESVGGFDERLIGYEDDDLFLRMFRRRFTNVYILEPLSLWRIHKASSSYSKRMAESRLIYALKLFETFPDEPELGLYYARDFVAPRFFRQAWNEYVQAVRSNDRESFLFHLRAMRLYIAPQRRSKRRKFSMVLPLLTNFALARFMSWSGIQIAGLVLKRASII